MIKRKKFPIDNFDISKFYTDKLVYSSTPWLTAHNAYANKNDGWKYHQQNYDLQEQFELGVRSFMIDVHFNKRDLYLCHVKCFGSTGTKGFKTLLVWLETLKFLLDEHPQEIITLHIEDHSGKSFMIVEKLKQVGLESLLLKSDPNNPFLTLGKMRKDNTRLVIFSDYQEERNYNFAPQEGIFPTTKHMETIFGYITFTNCEERPSDFRASYYTPNVSLFVFNYFKSASLKIEFPFLTINDYEKINSYDNIKKALEPCIEKGLLPIFIATDFIDEGKDGGPKQMVYKLLMAKKHNRKYLDDIIVNEHPMKILHSSITSPDFILLYHSKE